MFDPKRLAENPDLASSYGRYLERTEHFVERRLENGRMTVLPALTHRLWWFVHNAIAHPLIAIAPVKPLFDFHDYTSDKINGKR